MRVCTPNRLLPIIVIPLCAVNLAGGPIAREKGMFDPETPITLYSENNSFIGETKPGGLMSWCAVVDDFEGPASGMTVRFDLTSPSPGASFSFEGGGTTKTVTSTDPCAFACVKVTGTLTPPATVGSCVIKATHILPGGAEGGSQPGTAKLTTDACIDSTSPAPLMVYGPYRNAAGNPDSQNLTYRVDSTHIAAKCEDGKAKWNVSGLATFSAAGSARPNALFTDTYKLDDPAFARAPFFPEPNSNNHREVQINLERVDPCPKNPALSLGASKKFPPASARHHLTSTTAHELGHCLNLGHVEGSPQNRAALMWGSEFAWFVCGTEEPRWDEQQGMENNGY